MKIFLYLFLTGFFVYGQSKFDSLCVAIKHRDDTLKIKTLNDECWKNRSNAPVYAIKCGELALKLGKSGGYKNLQTRSLNLLGVVYRGVGNPDKSIAYLKTALDIAEEMDNKVEIGYAENNLGGAYRLKAYFPLALQHILRGYSIFEKIGNRQGMAYCLINIGFVYTGLKNHAKAEYYYKQTAKIRHEIGDTFGEAIARCEIARSLSIRGQIDEALVLYKELEKTYESLRDNSGLIQAWWGEGNIYLKKKNYQAAYKYLSKTNKTAEMINSMYWQIQSGNSLSLFYAGSGRFGEAENTSLKTIALAKKYQDYALIAECYNSTSRLYEIMNDSRNALKYSKLYSELKDSITALDNISGVSEMEALFQNEKVKRENALLQKNMEISDAQKRYSIIITFLFLGFSSVVYWRYRTEKTARQAQEQLRRSEEIYQRFFENTFLGIFHCNPDGGFMKVNPAMARLLGYDSPAHFIASVPAFYSLDTINKEKFTEIINRVSQGGGWHFSEEKLIRKDGAVITVKLNFRKEAAPDGKIAYIETIFEDITERKLAEEERETYSQKLAALNASKDRFFSIISHDLRGPFHGFLGMTKILADEGEFFPKEKLKKTGEDLFKSAQSQYRLLNNLLDWSRIQREDFRLNIQALNLKDEIKTVIEQMELTAGQKGVSLSSGIEETLMVSADYDLLHLLMRNMVSNAVKFSANGGRVIITGQKEQEFVKIAVIDNGVGIANENLEKLFRIDIRFTTKGTANEPGTGLGLMLCREIAEKHGGSISVESEPGKGSSFFVTLPSGED